MLGRRLFGPAANTGDCNPVNVIYKSRIFIREVTIMNNPNSNGNRISGSGNFHSSCDQMGDSLNHKYRCQCGGKRVQTRTGKKKSSAAGKPRRLVSEQFRKWLSERKLAEIEQSFQKMRPLCGPKTPYKRISSGSSKKISSGRDFLF